MRRLLLAFLVACSLILIFSKWSSLSEEYKSKDIILTATTFGIETIAHEDFVKKLILNTELEQEADIRIFLGPYISLLGNQGTLIQAPPNYYIFLDMHFYYFLNQDEKEALIAHETGHAIHKINFIDKIQLSALYKLGMFNKYRYKILTKYQIKADRFSAEKTSPKIMISLLNKLYLNNKYNADYKMRMGSLRSLKQAQ